MEPVVLPFARMSAAIGLLVPAFCSPVIEAHPVFIDLILFLPSGPCLPVLYLPFPVCFYELPFQRPERSVYERHAINPTSSSRAWTASLRTSSTNLSPSCSSSSSHRNGSICGIPCGFSNHWNRITPPRSWSRTRICIRRGPAPLDIRPPDCSPDTPTHPGRNCRPGSHL